MSSDRLLHSKYTSREALLNVMNDIKDVKKTVFFFILKITMYAKSYLRALSLTYERFLTNKITRSKRGF